MQDALRNKVPLFYRFQNIDSVESIFLNFAGKKNYNSCRKKPLVHGSDGDNNKVHVEIIENFCVILYEIRNLDRN